MSLKSICEFCQKYDRVFLYGAGIYGKFCLQMLKKNNITVDGFIVSKESRNSIEGIPVYLFSRILSNLTSSDGIVLSMKEKYQAEVFLDIPCRFHSQVLSINDDEWNTLHENEIENFFKELYKQHPVGKYTGNTQWKRILVVRLDCIGDMVWTTPFLRELRGNFPSAKITLVLRPQIEPLLRNCPYIDQIIRYEVPNVNIDPSHALQEKARKFAFKYLVGENFDVVFLPRPVVGYGIAENVFLAFFCGANMIMASLHLNPVEKNQRIYKKISPFFSLLTQSTLKTHSVEYILDMLRHCNCKIKNTAMELWPTLKERKQARALLQKKKNTLYIAVGVVGNLPDRTWDSKNYQELIRRCVRRYHQQIHFVLCGGSNAQDAARISVEGNERSCLDLTGKTSLPDAVAVIEACDFYLGSNTGLLHIAAAVHTPIIEIICRKQIYQDSGIWEAEGVRVCPMDYLDCDEEFPIEAIKVDDVEPVLLNMIEKCISRKN